MYIGVCPVIRQNVRPRYRGVFGRGDFGINPPALLGGITAHQGQQNTIGRGGRGLWHIIGREHWRGDAVSAVFIGLWFAARGFCGNPSRDCPDHEYRPSRGLWHNRFAQRGVVFIGDFGRVNDDTGQLVWAVCVAEDKQ